MARIFIIDDDKIIIDCLQIFLIENGHKVEGFNNAKSALLQYEESKPDFVFVDIFMPNISGFEFIKKLRAIDPKAYIIAMTGGIDPFNPNSCLFVAEKDGANIGISKPLDFEIISEIIKDQQKT